MAQYQTLTEANFSELVASTALVIKNGGVAVIAGEGAYLYTCDAFNHQAVARLHAIRGDAEYTAAQVLVASADVLRGLARDFDEDYQALTQTFWPGLLTIYLSPSLGLNWNLGDDGQLPEFAVRVPERRFLHAVVFAVGPVAAASAALSGDPRSREISQVPAMESDIATYVDEGRLEEVPGSTIIRRSIVGKAGGLELVREGAISIEELQAVVPTLKRQPE